MCFRYCGQQHGSIDIISETGNLTLIFVSDGSGSGTGFDIELSYKPGELYITLMCFNLIYWKVEK